MRSFSPSYDQVAQEALTPDSKVNSAKPDAVLFALDYRALPLKLSLGDPRRSLRYDSGSQSAILQALRNGIKANCNARLHLSRPSHRPSKSLFGSLDRALPGTLRSLLDNINRELAELLLGSGDVLFRRCRTRRNRRPRQLAQSPALEHGQVLLL